MSIFDEVLRAVDFIEENLKETINVQVVAQRSEYSLWQFQRVFARTTGETIGSYIRKRRLTASVAELQQPSMRVIDIAFEYGFGSSEAYSRAFKKMFGQSPEQFRQSGKKTVTNLLPKLDRSRLHHLVHQIDIEPEIVTISSMQVVGLRIVTVSPFSERMGFEKDVDEVWRRVKTLEPQISNKIGECKIGIGAGLVDPSALNLDEDEFQYFAGIAVAEIANKLPAPLEGFKIEAGTYARFRFQGFHQPTQVVLDFAYATWLPSSAYERGSGVDFTLLDHTGRPISRETAEMEFYLPVRKKSPAR